MLTFWFSAFFKSIPCESFSTATSWNVVDNFALGIDATSAWTRVHTLVVRAGLESVTVGVENALRTTTQVWVPKQSRWTLASANTISRFAYCTGSTRIGVAYVWFWRWSNFIYILND